MIHFTTAKYSSVGFSMNLLTKAIEYTRSGLVFTRYLKLSTRHLHSVPFVTGAELFLLSLILASIGVAQRLHHVSPAFSIILVAYAL
jgi:hypothetical protein